MRLPLHLPFAAMLAAILCAAAPALAQMTYNNPAVNGVAIDWCASWATACGQGGADQYCRSKGHGAALNWAVNRPGRTLVVGSNRYCQGPNCQGFTRIVCGGDAARNPANYPPGCTWTREGQVEPRASLLVVNRGPYTATVYVGDGPALVVGPHQNRRFNYVLPVGVNRVSILSERPRSPGDVERRSSHTNVRVLNQGPQTCQVVRQLIAN